MNYLKIWTIYNRSIFLIWISKIIVVKKELFFGQSEFIITWMVSYFLETLKVKSK